MQTPIDFGKDFLYRLYDQRDADACQKMLAGDLVWITPEDMHHFLSEGAVLKFLRKQIRTAEEARYVDLISIKSSPSAENIMTVAYEINLVSREEEKPLYLRCSMVICRRGRRLEITFLHFSTRAERDSAGQLRDFVTNLPCGVMILACLDGKREEAIFYNEYFAHRLRYRQEEFARAIAQNPFFMATEEDRDRIHEEIARARRNGGNIAANLRFYRRDGNSFYYRMLGAPACQADGGTVYYCVFQETTGFQLTADRLQSRLDTATGILRQIPEAICGIEYPPRSSVEKGILPDPAEKGILPDSAEKGILPDSGEKGILPDSAENLLTRNSPRDRSASDMSESARDVPAEDDADGDGDVKIYRNKRERKSAARRVSESGKSVREEPISQAGEHSREDHISRAGDHSREDHISRAGHTSRSPRVFFTSKNIPALFGVSNSAYMKNILQDPFYGLEITSITRRRLLATRLLDPGQTGPAGPVSCGIFRLRKRDALVQGTAASAQKMPDFSENTLSEPVSDTGKKRSSVTEPPRVELVVRRVREKDGTVRIYLFYYDREAQQQDLENRIDRAMKMGRAGQDQLRMDLRRAKESADRRQSELNASLKQLQEKSAADLTRVENQLQEEKKRQVLLARQLEESRAAQKQLAEDLEKAREDADYAVRSIRARTDRKIREAEQMAAQTLQNAGQKAGEAAAARRLLEDQLREAQERNRLLEDQLGNERARRRLAEEQLQTGGQVRNGVQTGKIISAFPARSGDWMTAEEPLTVFSSIDPVLAANAPVVSAPGAVSASGLAGPAGSAGPAETVSAAGAVSASSDAAGTAGAAGAGPARRGQAVIGGAAIPAARPDPEAEQTPADRFWLIEKKIRAREDQKAKRRLRALMEKADSFIQNPGLELQNPKRDLQDPGQNTQDTEWSAQSTGRCAQETEQSAQSTGRCAQETEQSAQSTGQGTNTGSGYQIPCTRENIRDIMEDFLEASSSGQALLQEKTFSPEIFLRNVLVYEGMACSDRGIFLCLFRDSRLPAEVTGFEALLQRALCEILENAIAHTPQGGTVDIHCRADRPSGGLVNLCFRIDDRGTGISPSRMQTIFEAEQAVDTGEPIHSGLFAAREAATLMGGSIHARSGRDGTRFSLNVALRIR